MEILTRVVGPLQTNVHLVADPATRGAIVIDAAIPGLSVITGDLAARGWRLLLIVSTHGHWDHAGENAALQAWSREAAALADHAVEHGLVVAGTTAPAHRPGSADGAGIAAHRDDWPMMRDPQPLFAPFPIPPCVPAVELAEGGVIRFGDVRLEVLHTPGHTGGSVSLMARDAGLLFSGDTLFAGGWGRVDLAGGDPAAMVDSLRRLATLPDALRVLPGHGRATTIGTERPWLEIVAHQGTLPT